MTKDAIQRAINKGAASVTKSLMETCRLRVTRPGQGRAYRRGLYRQRKPYAPEIRVLFKKINWVRRAATSSLRPMPVPWKRIIPDANIDRVAAAIEAGANDFENVTHEQNDDIIPAGRAPGFVCRRHGGSHCRHRLVKRLDCGDERTRLRARANPLNSPTRKKAEAGNFPELDEHDDVHRVWAMK